jgi:hypothetical protein
MDICYITCNSDLDRNIYPDNKSSNFYNDVNLFNGKNKEIGVTLLSFEKIEKEEEEEMEVDDLEEEDFDLENLFNLPEPETEHWNIIKVMLEEIEVNNNYLTHEDKCIFMMNRYDKITVKPKPITFYKLKNKEINRLHISLQNEFGEDITIGTKKTVIKFQIRECTPYKMKYIQLVSNEDINLYPNNNPIEFTNVVSEQWHQNIDFTNWEVALHSIFLTNNIIKKFDNMYIFNIYTDINGSILMKTGNINSLEDIPIKVKELEENKIQKYVPSILQFHPIERKTLDKITVQIQHNFEQKKADITFTAEELKTNATIIQLCFKEKLVY